MLAACCAPSGSAWAGAASASVSVSASVTGKCAITASALSFGTYDPVTSNASAPATGTGSLGITCTRSAPNITIALSLGTNATGNTRRLKSGADYIAYELYQPSSTAPNAPCTFPGTAIWGIAGGNLVTPSGAAWSSSSPQTFNVCGTVAGGQDARSGSYSDTVIATVSF
jgi:spore coat protein U-like protein